MVADSLVLPLSELYIRDEIQAVIIGPSEVHALPVRHCRRSACKRKWPLLLALFFSFLSDTYFSPRRGCPRSFEVVFEKTRRRPQLKSKWLRERRRRKNKNNNAINSGHLRLHAARLQRRTGSACTSLGPINTAFFTFSWFSFKYQAINSGEL